MKTDLNQILSEVDEQLNELASDEKVGKIASYVEESWDAKSNFLVYLAADYVKTYREKTKSEVDPFSSMRKYIYIPLLTGVGSVALLYSLQGGFSLFDLIGVIVATYISGVAAENLVKEKRNAYLKEAIENTIIKGAFKNKLVDFYSKINQD